MARARRHEGRPLKPDGRTQARKPLHHPHLRGEARSGRQHRIPEGGLAPAPELPAEVDVPGLLLRLGKPQHRVGDAQLHGPPRTVHARARGPHRVPAPVAALEDLPPAAVARARELRVVLHARRRHHEVAGVDAVLVGVDGHAEVVGVAEAVPLGELPQDGVRVRVVEPGRHVDGLVVVGEVDLGALAGRLAGIGAVLREVGGGLQLRYFQSAVYAPGRL